MRDITMTPMLIDTGNLESRKLKYNIIADNSILQIDVKGNQNLDVSSRMDLSFSDICFFREKFVHKSSTGIFQINGADWK